MKLDVVCLAVLVTGCASTHVVRAPDTDPGETAYGTEMHVFNAGLAAQRNVATGLAGSTPDEAGARKEGVWRLSEGGVRLQYCEGGACQNVPVGAKQSKWKGPLIMLDPVNLGAVLTQTVTTTPDFETGTVETTETTTGAVAIGDITTPFTRQRGAWIIPSARNQLWYCSAATGSAGCSEAPLGGGGGGSGLFAAGASGIKALSMHVVREGAERVDVLWVSKATQLYRCEGRADSPTPSCAPVVVK